jgi:hypothetical protein
MDCGMALTVCLVIMDWGDGIMLSVHGSMGGLS